MCHEPTELFRIGCLTGLILILKFRFYALTPLTPNINTQTFWPNLISHVTNGTIFLCCWTSAISALLAALRIPAWWAALQCRRRGCKFKKEEVRVVSKSWPAAMNLSSLIATSSTASSPIASKSPGMLKKWKIQGSVEFSSATARCILWRVDGHNNRETCRNKRELGDVDFSESETGSFTKKNGLRDRLLLKQLRGNPMHPVNQTTREVRNLKESKGHTIFSCLQPQFIIWIQSSRSSGRSTDENVTTLRMIWTWVCYLGHISE